MRNTLWEQGYFLVLSLLPPSPLCDSIKAAAVRKKLDQM